MIVTLVPLFSFVIYPAIDKVFPLTPLRKISIGLFVMVPGFAIVSMVQGWVDAGQTPSIAWQLFAYAILTASEVMVSITCLEFAYTQAPRSMKSVIMAVFLFSVSLGNYFTAGVNKLSLSRRAMRRWLARRSRARRSARPVDPHGIPANNDAPKRRRGHEAARGGQDEWGSAIQYRLINANSSSRRRLQTRPS